jgi:hypothetical protein
LLIGTYSTAGTTGQDTVPSLPSMFGFIYFESIVFALLEYSDVALYGAKTEGRDRVKRADQPSAKGDASNVFRVA